jgi:hypothetical protein
MLCYASHVDGTNPCVLPAAGMAELLMVCVTTPLLLWMFQVVDVPGCCVNTGGVRTQLEDLLTS